MAGALELQAAGIHAITIADNPLSRAADASCLRGVFTAASDSNRFRMTHDRNLNAIKSILLDLSARHSQHDRNYGGSDSNRRAR